MEEPSLSPAGAARILSIPEDEADNLACSNGRVLLSAIRDRVAGATPQLTLELARAREEVGRLSVQLKEVRATHLRLQKVVRDPVEERRRLTAEVLELQTAAEERSMLMQRLERTSRVEQERAEVRRTRGRGLLSRLLNR